MRQLGYYKEQSLSSHRPYARKEIYVQAVILTFFIVFYSWVLSVPIEKLEVLITPLLILVNYYYCLS